jgi:hypothetical protein
LESRDDVFSLVKVGIGSLYSYDAALCDLEGDRFNGLSVGGAERVESGEEMFFFVYNELGIEDDAFGGEFKRDAIKPSGSTS